jgi:hypothetical protein
MHGLKRRGLETERKPPRQPPTLLRQALSSQARRHFRFPAHDPDIAPAKRAGKVTFGAAVLRISAEALKSNPSRVTCSSPKGIGHARTPDQAGQIAL